MVVRELIILKGSLSYVIQECSSHTRAHDELMPAFFDVECRFVQFFVAVYEAS